MLWNLTAIILVNTSDLLTIHTFSPRPVLLGIHCNEYNTVKLFSHYCTVVIVCLLYAHFKQWLSRIGLR